MNRLPLHAQADGQLLHNLASMAHVWQDCVFLLCLSTMSCLLHAGLYWEGHSSLLNQPINTTKARLAASSTLTRKFLLPQQASSLPLRATKQRRRAMNPTRSMPHEHSLFRHGHCPAVFICIRTLCTSHNSHPLQSIINQGSGPGLHKGVSTCCCLTLGSSVPQALLYPTTTHPPCYGKGPVFQVPRSGTWNTDASSPRFQWLLNRVCGR